MMQKFFLLFNRVNALQQEPVFSLTRRKEVHVGERIKVSTLFTVITLFNNYFKTVLRSHNFHILICPNAHRNEIRGLLSYKYACIDINETILFYSHTK